MSESKCPKCDSLLKAKSKAQAGGWLYECGTIVALNGNIRFRSPECFELQLARLQAALEEAERRAEAAEGQLVIERVDWCKEALQCENGRKLISERAVIAGLQTGNEPFTDPSGLVWCRPSAEKHYEACAALAKAIDQLTAAAERAERLAALAKDAAQDAMIRTYNDRDWTSSLDFRIKAIQAMRDAIDAALLHPTQEPSDGK